MARPPDIIRDAHVFGASVSWSIKNNDQPPFSRPAIIDRIRTVCIPDYEGSEDPIPPEPEDRVYFTSCQDESLPDRATEISSSKSGDINDPENYSSTSTVGTLEGPSKFKVYRFSDEFGDPFEGTPISEPESISHIIERTDPDNVWSGGTGGLTGQTFSDPVTYYLQGSKGVYTSAAEAASLEPFTYVDMSDPSFNFAPSPTVTNDGFTDVQVMAGEYAIETQIINLLEVKCRITLDSSGSVSDIFGEFITEKDENDVKIILEAAETKVYKFSLGATSAFLAQANYVSELKTTIVKYEVDENDDGNYIEKPLPTIEDLFIGMRGLWWVPRGLLDTPQGAPPYTIPTETFQKYTESYADDSNQVTQFYDNFGKDYFEVTYTPLQDITITAEPPGAISAPVPNYDGNYLVKDTLVFGSFFAGADPLSTFGDPII